MSRPRRARLARLLALPFAIVPVRFLVPPEVSVLELRAAAR